MAVLHPPCPVSAASLDLPGTTITSQSSSKAQAQFNVLFIRAVRIGRASITIHTVQANTGKRPPPSVLPYCARNIDKF
jgi:hypothetical protein